MRRLAFAGVLVFLAALPVAAAAEAPPGQAGGEVEASQAPVSGGAPAEVTAPAPADPAVREVPARAPESVPEPAARAPEAPAPAPAASPAPAPAADPAPAPFTFRFARGASLKVYGKLELVTYYDTTTPAISDWLAYAQPKSTYDGREDAFSMSVRASPVGVHLNVPDLAGTWDLDSRVEIDFSGGFMTGGSSAYSPLLRLKQAWVSMSGKHVSILAGQHFGVFAPLFPDTANWIALGTSGNPWIRLPQIRLTLDWAPVKVEVSVNRPMGSNEVLNDSVNDHISDGEQSNVPFFMGRVGFTQPLGALTLAGGASGVYGREKIRRVYDPATGELKKKANGEYLKDPGDGQRALDRTVDVWMAALDLKVTSKYVDILGEFFIGDNLNSFFAGVLQGVSTFYTPPFGLLKGRMDARAIRTMGGWAQVIGRPVPDLSLGVGFGVDDPRNEDLNPATAGPVRSRNMTAYGNVGYKVGGAWLVGAECSWTRTTWRTSDPTQDPSNTNIRAVVKTSWAF